MQLEVWTAVMFQLAYTFAVIQKQIPGFRHNDLSWKNVRLTMPEGTIYRKKHGMSLTPCRGTYCVVHM